MKKVLMVFAFLASMMCAGVALADTSPATLNMSAWLQAGNYNASTGHWSGSSSTGGSGSVSGDSNGWDSIPDAGANLNSHSTVQFNGWSGLNASTSLNSLIATSHWSTFALVYSYGEGSDGNIPAYGYNATGILTSDGGDWGVMSDGYSSPQGIVWQTHNGSDYGAQCGFADSSWQLVQAYYDGTNVCARVNSDSWACNSSGSWSPATGSDHLSIGINPYAAYFNGLMAEVGVSTVAFSQSTFDGIKGYMNTRYGLSL